MRVVDAWHNKDRTRTARYGKGKRWVAVWRETPGKPQRKRSFTTKIAAEAFITERRREAENIAAGRAIRREPVQYGALVEEWLAQRGTLAKNTQASTNTYLKQYILPRFKDEYVNRIDWLSVNQWVSDLARTELERSTIGTIYSKLKASLNYAVKAGYIVTTPCKDIQLPKPAPKRVKPLTSETVQQIIDLLPADLPGLRAGVVFAASTGLRPSEWCGLTVDNIDLDTGIVRVEHQLAGNVKDWELAPLKTPHSYRDVEIGPAVVELLRPLTEDPGPAGLVFTYKDGGPLTYPRIWLPWKRLRETLGDHIGPGWHQLRHYHASLLIAGGASPVAVAKRLGHANANETLATYAHLWPSDQARLVSLSDGVVNLSHHENTTAP
ncbi:tyrosine-type recombinase/integrase [Pseudoglutamicibacter cumminsii]|uniref:tyrosine-type recombinase/integrase n=1 Tax=Pseudoglutamicibacter cumminsii TaxID=156979 RepID=UPI001958A068|nr:site-specific integrase [Pseudoglutamicibacter cumminsii]MBM7795807.1 integrase [Pseudoglutamicibacter cumminsii]